MNVTVNYLPTAPDLDHPHVLRPLRRSFDAPFQPNADWVVGWGALPTEDEEDRIHGGVCHTHPQGWCLLVVNIATMGVIVDEDGIEVMHQYAPNNHETVHTLLRHESKTFGEYMDWLAANVASVEMNGRPLWENPALSEQGRADTR